jgi:enterochelin esterase family protein
MLVAERVRGDLHPLLAKLREEPEGEPAFWARMAVERTPLIEPDPASPGHSVVTFVFRDPEADHVVFNDSVFGEVVDTVMDRIAGTATWFIAYRYRNDVRLTYSFTPNVPLVSMKAADQAPYTAFFDFLRTHPPTPDPSARETFVSDAGEGLPGSVASVVSLPDAPDQSVIEMRESVARGRIESHLLRSAVLDNERRIWVYTPPGYAADERAYPMLVVFDGGPALTVMPTPRVLDNLLADGHIAPAIAVFVDNASETSRNEELPCSEAFARFVEIELVPWVREHYAVSRDAKDGFMTGTSYGGLASMWLGYRLPHLFGNVISQSASLWWGPGCDLAKPLSLRSYEPEWLIDQYERSPRLPLRVWLEFGLMELDDLMIRPSRRMAAVLREKGYDLTYNEFAASHDWAHWRVSLAQALATMLAPACS